jgi:hypothetical protein
MLWCSPPFIGFIWSAVLVFVTHPLANAMANASPELRMILMRMLFSFSHLCLFLQDGVHQIRTRLRFDARGKKSHHAGYHRQHSQAGFVD